MGAARLPLRAAIVRFVDAATRIPTPDGERSVLGVEHHYEDSSTDLALWRIFYGAEGGELPGTA